MAYSFRMKEPGSEAITIQGFEGWAPKGFDSRPRITESGMTTGEPIQGRGPSKRNAWDALCRVRDRQEVSEWDPTVGRHRATEAQRMASAPTRETL